MAITEQLRLDLTEALEQLQELEQQLDALLQPVTIPVDVETDEALAELQRDIAAADNQEIDIDVDVDGIDNADDEFEDLRQEIERTEDTVDDLGDEAKRTGKELTDAAQKGSAGFSGLTKTAIGFAGAIAAFQGTRALVNFLGDAASAASDLAESTSKAEVVFGDFNSEIQAFAATAPQALGLSTAAALEFTATFGNLFVALGLTRAEAAELSPQIVQLGADLASFNNIAVDEALTALRAGLVGEVEPLRRLGVSINAATVEAKALELGLVGANGAIDEAAKVQARYALILEQTGTAQGDFARTADGLANTQRTLAAELDNAQAALGEGLIPVMQAAIPVVGFLITPFVELAETIATATGAITEAEAGLRKLSRDTGQAADSATLLAGAALIAAEELGNAARQRDQIRGVGDELQTVEGRINDLVDAWGGNDEAVEALLNNIDLLRDDFGLTEEAAEALADALENRLTQSALRLSDEVLRARVQNELNRTRQAMAEGVIEARNYEEAFIAAAEADITRNADHIERQNEALSGLRAAAEDAGISLGELLLDVESLPPELQVLVGALSEVQLQLAQTEGVDRFTKELDRLPGALAAAGDAFKTEAGDIEDDFTAFLDSLTERLSEQRAFQTNLDILRAFGLDDLAAVFEAEGIAAASLLADAIANPEEARRAEEELDAQYTQITEGLGETMADVLGGAPFTPALVSALETALADAPPEVQQAIIDFATGLSEDLVITPTIGTDIDVPPNLLEGLDLPTAVIPSVVGTPSGGSSIVGSGGGNLPEGQGLTVNINNPTTQDLQTDSARAGQEIGAVVRNLGVAP